MPRLTAADLWTLEEYARRRPEYRAAVIAHKKTRQVALGPNARLYFEDAVTIRYQIQEMLRIERVFEPGLIEEELNAYNPLIPDGHNWKATFMLEYDDPAERRAALQQLRGVEDCVWLQVDGCPRIPPVADEDLERSNASKTAAVHFLRFELTAAMISAVQGGAGISAGIDHPACQLPGTPLTATVRDSLAADLH